MPSSGHTLYHALRTNKWTSDANYFHAWHWQQMESPYTETRSHHQWQYKYKNNCWWHFKLGKIAWNGVVIYWMPTLHLPGLPTFIEHRQESILPQALQTCQDWHLFRQISSCHVKPSATWALTSTGMCPGCCKKLSGLSNSTASSYLNLSFKLPHFMNLQLNLNTPSLLHRTRPLHSRISSPTNNKLFYPTPA